MNLTEDKNFDAVEPRIEDSSEWMVEYGAVEIEDHGIELVWGVGPDGFVAAGKGGWIHCHLNDTRVTAVENDEIPMHLKLAR